MSFLEHTAWNVLLMSLSLKLSNCSVDKIIQISLSTNYFPLTARYIISRNSWLQIQRNEHRDGAFTSDRKRAKCRTMSHKIFTADGTSLLLNKLRLHWTEFGFHTFRFCEDYEGNNSLLLNNVPCKYIYFLSVQA